MISRFLILPILAILLLTGRASGQEKPPSQAITQKEKEKPTEGANQLVDRIQDFSFLKYARKLADKLDSRERKVDPFGMAMDPEDEVPEIVYEPGPDDLDDGPKTTLQQAVSKFRVSGVNPARKEVIVGAQILRVGDHVVIKHGDVSFHLKIQDVQSDSIQLADVETGEVAGVSIGIVQAMPSGMSLKQPDRRAGENDAMSGGRIVPMSRNFLTLDLDADEQREEGQFNRRKKNP